MENSTSELKKKLISDWGQMKDQYPIVMNRSIVSDDPVKTDFLNSIEGFKSAEEIGAYFALSPTEAQLIFTDLLNLGAVRFLDKTERFAYLKQHSIELERNLEFAKSERVKLSGEAYYLNKQIKDREHVTESIKQRITELEEGMKGRSAELLTLKEKSTAMWDNNSELFGLAKEIKDKSQRIKNGLEKLEQELPRAVKKKAKIADRLNKANELRQFSEGKNKIIEKKLVDYHDALDDVREHLLDVKMHVDDLSGK